MLLVQDMLARTARDHPAKEAIASRAARLSYAELDRASSRLAAFLRANGVEKGMRVAISSSKCADEVVAIFAIARAGGVLVHINPAFRDEQVQHVIRECEPRAFVFHRSKASTAARAIESGLAPALLVEIGSGAGADAPAPIYSLHTILDRSPHAASEPAAGVEEGDLAAIIYTSGTTARAKGITVTHRILAESSLVSAEVLGNVASDRLISLTPFSFDGALSQLFTATLVGGTLVLQDSQFPKDVVATLVGERITGFHAVPSFWRMMLDRYPSLGGHQFTDLRYLSLIGETFPEDELMTLKGRLPHVAFYVMYGTTEAFRSTCLAPADFARKRGSVGKPLPGVEIVIVDERGHRTPAGTVGEIVHRGAFVSPGYWRRDGGGTFRDGGVHTGDLGVFDDEGYLYFVGRKDSMIKRLGFQVYPEEIEACLAKIDGVALAAVVSTADRAGSARLRAVIVPAAASSLTREEVAGYCRRHLPHYMMPDDIAFRDAMPTTGTCKIDRARLAM
jgi:acyl-CoA synthetase (AMP-forming)/AMP-acid ligase II